MKYDPNFILSGLDGKPLVGTEDDIHAGKLLAQALFYTKGDYPKLKLHGWALKLYAKQPIEIDKSDKEVLSHFIETAGFPPASYMPLIDLLNKSDE